MNSLLRRLLPWTFPVVLVGSYVWSVLAATAALEPSVGEIQDVKGSGWGISALGEKYDKLGGDLVVMDEVVATGFNSAMTLQFIDNTTMTLGPNAEITIDQMVYNPEDGDNDAVTFRLGKGSFYFVSGLVAKDKVTIITPTATIGIRGTELVIDVGEDGSTSVGVAKGHAFMRSNHDGRSVEVEVGSTAQTNGSGAVSDPFPGIDLTGDEDVDRKIPGVSEWLDDEEQEDEKNMAELASGKHGDEEDEDDHPMADHEEGSDEDSLAQLGGQEAGGEEGDSGEDGGDSDSDGGDGGGDDGGDDGGDSGGDSGDDSGDD